MRRLRVTRYVAAGEAHNFLGRAVLPGEVLFEFNGQTYGCCDEVAGIACALVDDPAAVFFEFPRDAVQLDGWAECVIFDCPHPGNSGWLFRAWREADGTRRWAWEPACACCHGQEYVLAT